jgi:hypothetical protein
MKRIKVLRPYHFDKISQHGEWQIVNDVLRELSEAYLQIGTFNNRQADSYRTETNLMNEEPLLQNNNNTAQASPFHPCDFCPSPESERLFKWAGLAAANTRMNLACIEQYQESLLALGETAKRLNALDHWRHSLVFTERERVALSLSETISSKNPAQFSLNTLKIAQSHFTPDETVRLALTVLAVNDWIDWYEKKTKLPFLEAV